MKKQVMTPEHELWNDFYERLSGQEGCNFREDKEKGIIWDCPGDHEKPLARAILKSYGNINIKKSLKYFEEHGGRCCDCEIVFNVGN